MLTGSIAAVTVDLDDTLYPQADYLAGAWQAVTAAARTAGVPAVRAEALHEALVTIAAEGSDRGGIIDRALAACALPGELAPALVDAFKTFAPVVLAPYPGAVEALARLRRLVPVGCLTDGDSVIQRAKLAALGLDDAFDAIVISDELGGRELRKPHPLPFRTLLARLDVDAPHAVHIGDRYAKDVVGAHSAGLRAVRVMTGEYAGLADPADAPAPDLVCADAREALTLLAGYVEECAARSCSASRRAASTRCSAITRGEFASA